MNIPPSIAALDFSRMTQKLLDPEEGAGLTANEIDLANQEYQRFLTLHLANLNRPGFRRHYFATVMAIEEVSMSNTQYTAESEAEAIKQVIDKGQTIVEVAAGLDLPKRTSRPG